MLQAVYLDAYEEVIGTLRGIEKDEFTISLIFDDFQVIFNLDSEEGEIVEKTINSGLIGEKIGLLRTDSPDNPLIFRKIEDEKKERTEQR
ncbi:MAG: hypothetical protein QMD80_07635 [archaeon]|nr:hypothetical protein [archaeon]